ncbi:MAG: protein kinase [Myxococcota bacterium]
MKSPDRDDRVGQVLGGKYAISRFLGAGGMAEVYLATNQRFGRPVALKLLRHEAAQRPGARERFLREARAAGAVRHRNIVDILDVDELPDGTMFIVQEYLEGEDLAARLLRGPLGGDEAVATLLPVAEALSHAHRQGIVHRDLKPDNVFLAVDGPDGAVVPKVLDFGISKLPVHDELRRSAGQNLVAPTPTTTARPQNRRLTEAGSAMGTPYYMSPEQIRDPATVGASTDVWSFGVVLYEALTGTMPFDAETLPGLFGAICSGQPRDLRRLAPHVPTALAMVVSRCLAPEPAARYRDAGALARALVEVRGAHSVTAASAHGGAGGLPLTPPTPRHAPPATSVSPPFASAPAEGDPGVAAANDEVDFGLELDLPRAPRSRPAADPASASASAATSAARPASARPRSVLDDDDWNSAAPLRVELDDGSEAWPHARSADGLAASTGEPHAAPSLPQSEVVPGPRMAAPGVDGAPVSAPATAVGPPSATPRSVARPPAPKLGRAELIARLRRMAGVGVTIAVVTAAGRTLTPEGLTGLDAHYGAWTLGPLLAGTGLLLACLVGVGRWALRLPSIPLFVSAGAQLLLVGASAASGALVAAPGLVPTVVRKALLIAAPYAALVALAGLGAFAVSRGRELWMLGSRAWAVATVGGGGLAAMVALARIAVAPFPGVADVTDIELGPRAATLRDVGAAVGAAQVGARTLPPRTATPRTPSPLGRYRASPSRPAPTPSPVADP